MCTVYWDKLYEFVVAVGFGTESTNSSDCHLEAPKLILRPFLV